MSNNPPAPPAIVAATHPEQGVIRYFMLEDEDQIGSARADLEANGYQWVHLIDIYDAVPRRPFMTVRDVIATLSKCDPDLPVLMDDGDGWFTHPSQLILPSEEEGYVLPTFITGQAYDCRAW